jgi:membrane associated rhomboid family serine protease
MKDRSLDITLIIIFAISGIAVTLLAWLWPAMEAERITATLAGMLGLIIGLVRYIGLRKSIKRENERITVEVEAREKR